MIVALAMTQSSIQASNADGERIAAAAATALPSQAALAIRTESLGREIDGRAILHHIDLNVARGEFVALLGANGAGKSTLLKILAMLVPATSGKLFLFGEACGLEAARLRARIGLIGHGAMLYRDLSPLENLVFFGRLYGVQEPRERARQLLDWLELGRRANDPVKTFSRGMLQRVAIARALMHEPELLLADEPFAGLDAPSMDALSRMLTSLHEEGRTIILTNHDIAQSIGLAHRAVVLRRGRVVIDAPTASMSAAAILREVIGDNAAGGQPR